MIDKPVLDALAAVIKEERARLVKLVEDLGVTLRAQQTELIQFEGAVLQEQIDACLLTITTKLNLVTSGADGKDGRDGVDGKDGHNGIDGTNGKDGHNGMDGKVGENGAPAVDGRDGLDGKAGVDGRNGLDGERGVDGREGIDGLDRDLVAPYYPAADAILERGSLAYSQGGLFQAVRKTVGCPATDPGSYRLVVNGVAKAFYEKNYEGRTTALHTRMADGALHIIELDAAPQLHMSIPEICVEGDVVFSDTVYSKFCDGQWVTTNLQGRIGLQGIRGRKGLRGENGVGIEDALIDRNHIILTLTNGEVKSLPLEMPQLPEQVKMHGVHTRAPADPPVDYLWVDATGHAQIWDGKSWIKLQ